MATTTPFNFEQYAQQIIIDSNAQSETPFRSAIGDAFSTVSSTLKVADSLAKSAYFASMELQMEQMNSLIKAARSMDAKNEQQAIIAAYQANELRKQMEAKA